MKTAMTIGAAILTLGLAAEPAAAQGRPGGCLKYGLGGAIAGHVAGGHRLKGALAGCVIGLARRRQYEREVQERRRNEQIARERSRGPDRTAERNPAPQPRAERIPGPFPDAPSPQQRVDRAPRPVPEARPIPERMPSPEPRSPYEDLGLGRSVPPAAPAPRQEAGRRRAPGDGFQTEGHFSRSPIDPAPWPDRRRQPPAPGPEETGSFLRGNGTVY